MLEPPARVDYDQALKRLLAQAHDGFLALIAPDVRWLRERSPELPAVARQADLVWEVAGEDDQPGLLHVELQAAVEHDMGERLLEYAVRLLRQHHLPVRSVVVFLREAATIPAPPFVMVWGRRECLRYDFDVIRLWEIPQERVLETPYYALWPLASLMAGVTAETTVAVAERIASAPVSLEERRELTGLLAVLASRRLTPEVVRDVLRRNQMLEELLRESSLAEIWIQEGREQGREEGREEGRQEGSLLMARLALEGRFGLLPEDVLTALRVADNATVRDLVQHMSAETFAQIRQRLGLS